MNNEDTLTANAPQGRSLLTSDRWQATHAGEAHLNEGGVDANFPVRISFGAGGSLEPPFIRCSHGKVWFERISVSYNSSAISGSFYGYRHGIRKPRFRLTSGSDLRPMSRRLFSRWPAAGDLIPDKVQKCHRMSHPV